MAIHGIDLVSRQLTAFAGLGSLRHLDLQFVGVDEILARHTEAARCHLLDRAAPGIAVRQRDEPLGILAAFAGVRLPAEAVHGDGQRLVRLLADRPIRHRAGGETLHDRLDRIHFVDRDGRPRRFQTEQAAQGRAMLVLHVDGARVFLEDLVLATARRVLELVDRFGIEKVILAVPPPLIVTADDQFGSAAPGGDGRTLWRADGMPPLRRPRCRCHRCVRSCA